MQSACHPIEFDKAAGDASDTAFALVELLDRFDRLHYLVFHREHLTFETVFTHGENALFHFVEQIVHFVLLFVCAPDTLGGSQNDLAQNVFIANDLQVVFNIRGSRDEREQAGDKCRTAHAFEEVSVAQDLRERNQVNCLSGIPKIDEDTIDRLVGRDVKILLINFLNTFANGLPR